MSSITLSDSDNVLKDHIVRLEMVVKVFSEDTLTNCLKRIRVTFRDAMKKIKESQKFLQSKFYKLVRFKSDIVQVDYGNGNCDREKVPIEVFNLAAHSHTLFPDDSFDKNRDEWSCIDAVDFLKKGEEPDSIFGSHVLAKVFESLQEAEKSNKYFIEYFITDWLGVKWEHSQSISLSNPLTYDSNHWIRSELSIRIEILLKNIETMFGYTHTQTSNVSAIPASAQVSADIGLNEGSGFVGDMLVEDDERDSKLRNSFKPLVRPLVCLSNWANTRLGLPLDGQSGSKSWKQLWCDGDSSYINRFIALARSIRVNLRIFSRLRSILHNHSIHTIKFCLSFSSEPKHIFKKTRYIF